MTYDPSAFVTLPTMLDTKLLSAINAVTVPDREDSRAKWHSYFRKCYDRVVLSYTVSDNAHVQPTDHAEDQTRRHELLKELDVLLTGPGTGAEQPRLADIVRMVRAVVDHEGQPLISVARVHAAMDARVLKLQAELQGGKE